MVRRLLSILILFLFPLVVFASADGPIGYTQKLIRSDYQEISFEVNISNLQVERVNVNAREFSRLVIRGSGVIGDVGSAQLPAIREFVWIPEGATVSLEVESPQESVINLPDLGYSRFVYPTQLPRPKIEGVNVEFAFDPNAYKVDKYLYVDPAKIVDEGYMRARRFVTVEIRPIAYNPVQGALFVRDRIVVKLKLKGADPVQTDQMLDRYDNYYHWLLSRSAFVNPDGFGSKQSVLIPTTPIGYLVIVPPDFMADATFNTYMSWLRQKGFYVTILSTADTTSDADNIKGWIDAAYQWDIPPAFVLLVGDIDNIGYFNDLAPSDLYFSTVAGNDYFPDIFVGRISVTNTTQLDNILNKLMAYEEVLWTVGDAWILKSSFLASMDNYQVSEETHDFVINTYLTPAGYSADKFYSHQGATAQQVLDAVNEGRSLVIYSGHGSEDSWADGPPIDSDQIRSLFNPVFPLVCSFACLTGNFVVPECFGETWLRIASGAIVFWGSSVPSYWDQDDTLERKMFEGFFASPGGVNLTWVEGMFQYGKLGVYAQWLGTDPNMVQMYFEMYNCFGDPSTDIWTASPVVLNLQIPKNVDPAQPLVVNVGLARALAGVTSGDAVLGSAFTDASGVAQIQLDPALEDGTQLVITVSGHNMKPFQANATVGNGSDDDSGDDDSGGNGNEGGGGGACGC